MRTKKVYIKNNCICFDIILENNAEKIRSEADSIIDLMQYNLNNLTKQIDTYNDQLTGKIKSSFISRKMELLKKNETLASLGVPIKKNDNLPETYVIPTTKIRKKINVRPEITEQGYKPEPTLDNIIYQDILKTIYDFGKVFERLPATYNNKKKKNYVIILYYI